MSRTRHAPCRHLWATGEDVEQSLVSSPLRSTLSATAAGRTYKVDSAPWFDGYNLAAAAAVIADLRRILLS